MFSNSSDAKSIYDRNPLEDLPPPSYAQATAPSPEPLARHPHPRSMPDSQRGHSQSSPSHRNAADTPRLAAEQATRSRPVDNRSSPEQPKTNQSRPRMAAVGLESPSRIMNRGPRHAGLGQRSGGGVTGRIAGRFESLTGEATTVDRSSGGYGADGRYGSRGTYGDYEGGGAGRVHGGLREGGGLLGGGGAGGRIRERRSTRRQAGNGILGVIGGRREARGGGRGI